MTVTFYSVSDDARVLNKTLGDAVATLSAVEIWGECSIMDPVLKLVYDADLLDANYCYISDWKRYYYIENYDVSNGREMYVRMHEDVLMSNATAIGELTCTIVRTAQNGIANLYLDDGKFKILNYPRIQTKKFPNALNKNLHYVLTVAGGS